GYPRRVHSFPTRRSSDLERGGVLLQIVELLLELALVGAQGVCGGFLLLAKLRLGTLFLPQRSHLLEHVLWRVRQRRVDRLDLFLDRKSTRLNSSHVKISY